MCLVNAVSRERLLWVVPGERGSIWHPLGHAGLLWNSEAPDGAQFVLHIFSCSRWRRGRGKADGSWYGSGPGPGTQPGALDPGNSEYAPDFSTNKEKSVVTRHTL